MHVRHSAWTAQLTLPAGPQPRYGGKTQAGHAYMKQVCETRLLSSVVVLLLCLVPRPSSLLAQQFWARLQLGRRGRSHHGGGARFAASDCPSAREGRFSGPRKRPAAADCGLQSNGPRAVEPRAPRRHERKHERAASRQRQASGRSSPGVDDSGGGRSRVVHVRQGPPPGSAVRQQPRAPAPRTRAHGGLGSDLPLRCNRQHGEATRRPPKGSGEPSSSSPTASTRAARSHPPDVSGLASAIDVPVYVISVLPPHGSQSSAVAVSPDDGLSRLASWTGGDVRHATSQEQTDSAIESLMAECGSSISSPSIQPSRPAGIDSTCAPSAKA